MFKKLKKKCQVKNSIIKHFYDFFFQSVEFHIYNEEYYFKCMYALQMISQTFDNYLHLSLSTNHNKCFNKTLDYKLLLKTMTQIHFYQPLFLFSFGLNVSIVLLNDIIFVLQNATASRTVKNVSRIVETVKTMNSVIMWTEAVWTVVTVDFMARNVT